MTFEEFKKKEAWLNRAFKLRKKKAALNVEWQELQRLRDACTNTSIKQGSGGKSSKTNTTEEKLIRYADALESYYAQVGAERNRYYAIRAEIKSAINSLPIESEQYVLYYRFICFLKLSEIAKKMNYSISHVKRLKRRGIEHICIKDDT